MTNEKKLTGLPPWFKPRLTASERRAAQKAADATKQAQLKREAAERRLARQVRNDARATVAMNRAKLPNAD